MSDRFKSRTKKSEKKINKRYSQRRLADPGGPRGASQIPASKRVVEVVKEEEAAAAGRAE